MRHRRVCVFLACAALCLFAPSAHAEGARRALVLGCDRFVSQQSTWPSASNSVTRVAAALQGGGTPLSALTAVSEGLDTAEKVASLVEETFSGAQEGDVSFFYIATHGLWEEGQPAGDMTLLLSDGEREAGLTASELKTIFDRVPGQKVLIVDACHSGAMIGKGVDAPFTSLFSEPEYRVICSSGGMEESWFWASGDQVSGEGYFSGALVAGLSEENGYAADLNRDGAITLSELKRYLRSHHGASTVHTWPEESDEPLVTYAGPARSGYLLGGAVANVVFEEGALLPEAPETSFSFTVTRPAQVGYQIVYQKDGRWDFEGAAWQWDNAELYGEYGDTPGALSPGFKERTLSLSTSVEGDPYGYVLVQMFTQTEDETAVAASTVLCVPPSSGNPRLALSVEEQYLAGHEVTAVVRHSLPCELTVWVEDENGQVVQRLLTAEPTRPEQLKPTGTTVVWNGRLPGGEAAPPGVYLLKASTRIGTAAYTAEVELFVEPERPGRSREGR